jgi:hypothetical protein
MICVHVSCKVWRHGQGWLANGKSSRVGAHLVSVFTQRIFSWQRAEDTDGLLQPRNQRRHGV